jgi:hypothetical protein
MSTRTVKIHVAPTGRNFGVVGQLRARNGRVIWESDVLPRGFEAAAREAAAAAAERKGWTVAE